MKLKFFLLSLIFLHLNGTEHADLEPSGVALYNQGSFLESLSALKKQTTSSEPFERALATLYSAKALLALNRLEEAKSALSQIDPADLRANPAAFHELEYTQGMLAYQKGDLITAVLWLQKAMPKRNFELAEWGEKTALLLDEVLKQLSSNPRLTLKERKEWSEQRNPIDSSAKIEDDSDYAKASALYKKGHFADAKDLFSKDQTTAEALYWMARCEEKIEQDPTKAQKLYRELATRYPESHLAPEAYFSSYSIDEYIQGSRQALKHLQQLPKLYPETPYTLKALYLLGLDAMRDRKSPEGKILSRSNKTYAIDLFQEVETLYDTLDSQNGIPADQKEEWAALRTKALFRRAKLNAAIGASSQGAKKDIYYRYAADIYRQMLTLDTLNKQDMMEASYELALAAIELQEINEADGLLQKIIAEKDANPYLFARSLHTLAKLHPEKAIPLLDKALLTGKDSLSHEELLTIMLERAQALKKSGQQDLAMQQLSEVVNYNAVSPLRLKAMLMRAELYEEQNKRVLARKQLESLALKSGPWAEAAKKKLEQEYGFN